MREILFAFLSLFIIAPLWADVITQNIPNGCDGNANSLKMIAEWTPNSYTCAPGYFLPANGIECVKCSPDHECSGGTFVFNETVSQGIKFGNTLTTDFAGGCTNDYLAGNAQTYAKWKRNSYECGAGYYLPMDGIECAKCPDNNYCTGGTYNYSETMTQGNTACPSEYAKSSIGAQSIDECFTPCTPENANIDHATAVDGNRYSNGTNTCVATECENGWHAENGTCIANTITIHWDGAESSVVTYGGDIVTPVAAKQIPGKAFKGWKFVKPTATGAE